jgi:hypothetical protein
MLRVSTDPLIVSAPLELSLYAALTEFVLANIDVKSSASPHPTSASVRLTLMTRVSMSPEVMRPPGGGVGGSGVGDSCRLTKGRKAYSGRLGAWPDAVAPDGSGDVTIMASQTPTARRVPTRATNRLVLCTLVISLLPLV